MSKFAVAYFSHHTGELVLEFVEADNELEAAVKFLGPTWADFGYTDLESLLDNVANCDSYLEVKEILS